MELIEYLEKLEIHENKKEWDELLKLSEEAVENFPYSQTLKIYKIRALIEKERLNEAKFMCDELIKTNPGSSIIHFFLADIYEKKGDIKRAIDEYNKILFLNPGDTKSVSEIERLKKILGEDKSSEGAPPEDDLVESEEKEEFNAEADREKIALSSEEEVISEEVENDGIKVEAEEEMLDKDEVIEKGEKPTFAESIEEKKEDNFHEGFEDTITTNRDILPEKEKAKDDSSEQVEREVISEEDLYTTVSMADILEKQGKYYEAQKIFYKLYKKGKSLSALRGYKRTGLKFYESFLNKLNRRMKRSV